MAINCPKCHFDNPEDTNFCGKCATPLPGEPGETLETAARNIGRISEELATGALIAAKYRILAKLGAGGMGEVYRAEDISLDRHVAIKVLPDVFAGDPERLARFQREARVLASLNHSNIAAIYGVEEADGKRFLVLELVEGETLAERLVKGPLSLEGALDVCRQIAEGLEAAHEKNIIHRDLKPSNVKIDPEGKVKILDFGLAKAFSGETTVLDMEKSPTITAEMTRPGVILGTAAYMSPEQAKGKVIDKRTDIWAFGCILFECLTGKKAFEGETTSETIASILKGEPDWKELPPSTQVAISALIRRCLRKDKNRRQHDISDARIEIEEALASPEDADQIGALAARKINWRQVIPFVLGTVVVTALATTLVLTKKKPSVAGPVVRLEMGVEPAKRLGGSGITEQRVGYWRPSRTAIALSPDGRIVVFQGVDEKRSQLYRRALEKDEAEPIPSSRPTEDRSASGQMEN